MFLLDSLARLAIHSLIAFYQICIQFLICLLNLNPNMLIKKCIGFISLSTVTKGISTILHNKERT